MPWGRLDDGLYDHPKVEALGRDRLAGVGLRDLAISWSNRRLTDGFIPAERIRMLGGSKRLADRLVEVGLFDEAPGGYQIHDFLDFNDSAEMVQARRVAAAERQRKHRDVTPAVTRESQRDKPVTVEADRTAVTPLSQRESRHSTRAPAIAPPGARPDPTRPNPDHEEIPPPPAERGTRKNGTSPRQQGTAPRQTGDNPRANGTSPRQERQAEKQGGVERLGSLLERVHRATTALEPEPAADDLPWDRS